MEDGPKEVRPRIPRAAMSRFVVPSPGDLQVPATNPVHGGRGAKPSCFVGKKDKNRRNSAECFPGLPCGLFTRSTQRAQAHPGTPAHFAVCPLLQVAAGPSRRRGCCVTEGRVARGRSGFARDRDGADLCACRAPARILNKRSVSCVFSPDSKHRPSEL